MTKRSAAINWMDNVVNKKSPTFCGAKWYNATIWLGNGATASCHHPPPHQIDADEVRKNPKALHNTEYKKLVRKQMLEGIQTKECDYCWRIENMDSEVVSDRYYKSSIYSDEELQEAADMPWDADVNLKQLEIAFDNNCNFACSYCNAGFSTTWAHDINKNGAYQDLTSDGWGAFAHNGNWAHPYGVKNQDNPYVEAFWKWWESDLQYSLRELRVTGGEATVSYDFWKLVEWYENNPHCPVELSVNTNLGVKRRPLDRLCKLSHNIKGFNLFTSNESMGSNAEYIRDGLIWPEWQDNLRYVMDHGKFQYIHVMMTINALCLVSFCDFHEFLLDLRENNPDTRIEFSHNILRFPSFQSITTLPKQLREQQTEAMTAWLAANEYRLQPHEIDGFNRTVRYVQEIDEGHNIGNLHSDLEKRQRDFRNFYAQYDRRRGKTFSESFANWPELVEWYEHVDGSANVNKIDNLIEGDATEWGRPIFDEVLGEARKQKPTDDK